MKHKNQYIAPELTVVEFKVERGYVLSNFADLLFWESTDNEQVEAYQEHDIWNDGNGFWN